MSSSTRYTAPYGSTTSCTICQCSILTRTASSISSISSRVYSYNKSCTWGLARKKLMIGVRATWFLIVTISKKWMRSLISTKKSRVRFRAPQTHQSETSLRCQKLDGRTGARACSELTLVRAFISLFGAILMQFDGDFAGMSKKSQVRHRWPHLSGLFN